MIGRKIKKIDLLFLVLVLLTIPQRCAAPPSFDLADPQPSELSIHQGKFGTFVLTIIPKNGFSGIVSFELLDRKNNGQVVGIDISPVAASIIGISSQTFVVNVAEFVEPKKYEMKIRTTYGASKSEEKKIDIIVLPKE